ncbi:MAG: 3'-5' exonuclease [Legionella sp.]|nr:3'-5' exonuclease [Legionella sp.]
MSILVFDIETVPDVASGRKLYDLDGLSDADTAKALFALRKKKVGHTFLPHHLQRIVAISLVMHHDNTIKVWSLGDKDSDEAELIQRFFTGLEKHTPTLVSWNGSGFDLPVLHYRALLHNIQAPKYWEVGEQQQNFKYNNYLNRFHYRHLDLMDVLAGYQNRAFAPLDEMASMLGFPGKMGMSGAHVWDEYLAGNLSAIRDYCETDVLNTFCVYLKFERMRGKLTEARYTETIEQLCIMLEAEKKPHLTVFLQAITDNQF